MYNLYANQEAQCSARRSFGSSNIQLHRWVLIWVQTQCRYMSDCLCWTKLYCSYSLLRCLSKSTPTSLYCLVHTALSLDWIFEFKNHANVWTLWKAIKSTYMKIPSSCMPVCDTSCQIPKFHSNSVHAGLQLCLVLLCTRSTQHNNNCEILLHRLYMRPQATNLLTINPKLLL